MSQENTSFSITSSTTNSNTSSSGDVASVDTSSFIKKLPMIPRFKFLKTSNDAKKPTIVSPTENFEYDLFCINDVTIESNTSQIIDTGIVLLIDPSNQFFPKIIDKIDVVLTKHCHVFEGILDPSHKESIKVILFNFDNNETIHFKKGDPIAKIMTFPKFIPKLIPQNENNTNFHTIRGDRGFGEVTKDFLHEMCQENRSVGIDTSSSTTTTTTNNNNNNSGGCSGDFVKENLTIEFLKTNNDAITPIKLSPDSVGYDLFCISDVTIKSNTSQIIDTGIVLLMDPNALYFPKICDKYSVVWKKHCHVLGGILDPGYRGSIKVILFNYDNDEIIHFQKGDSIAQIVFSPVILPKLDLYRNNLYSKIKGTGEKNKMIDVHKTSNDAIIPIRLSPDSVGYDLFCINDVTINSNTTQIIDTGIYICKDLFHTYDSKIFDKSSVVCKKHCYVLCEITPSNYTESLKVILFNFDNNETIHFQKGDPIAQIIFFPAFFP